MNFFVQKHEQFENINRIIHKIKSSVINENIVPTLPPKTTNTPTFIFDLDFLVCNRFKTGYLDFFVSYRKYYKEFLFNMAQRYELVSISEMYPAEGLKIVDDLDKYGCISYRLFVNSKNDLKLSNINRKKHSFVIIDKNHKNYREELHDRIIEIPDYNGIIDNDLLKHISLFTSSMFLRHQTINVEHLKKFDGDFYIQLKKDYFIDNFPFIWGFKENISKSFDKYKNNFAKAKLRMDRIGSNYIKSIKNTGLWLIKEIVFQ